jgi:hypothetical protein
MNEKLEYIRTLTSIAEKLITVRQELESISKIVVEKSEYELKEFNKHEKNLERTTQSETNQI